ncbi:putative membrane protein [Desulfitispora alkaliphila]|uniref:phage holin family protein n=1 Tax=Desulfitispora alkaliphila TaxID=622674 RepID=UPI003D1D3E74
MTGLLIRWGINALSLILTAYIIEGITVAGFGSALIAVLVLGIVNALIRPLVFLLTLPITILTLGLFTFVINATMLYMVGSAVVGFEVSGFVPAILGTIVMSVISTIANGLVK